MSIFITENNAATPRQSSVLAFVLAFVLAVLLLLAPAAQAAWKYENTVSADAIWNNPFGPNTKLLFYSSGGDDFRYSSTRPGSTGDGSALTEQKWLKMENGLMVRVDAKSTDGALRVDFGADGSTGYVDDYNGTHSGTAWIWNNDYLWEIDYTMYYKPFPEVVVPSSVVDLGTCHKSVGGTLSKEVHIGVRIHGYTSGQSYPLYRNITSSDTPEGGAYTDTNQSPITLGADNVIISSVSSALPQDYTDKFNVVLDCDKAPIGQLTWSASVKYTIE